MNESLLGHQTRECILFQKVILKKKKKSCSVYSRRLDDYDPDLQQVNTQKVLELENYNI